MDHERTQTIHYFFFSLPMTVKNPFIFGGPGMRSCVNEGGGPFSSGTSLMDSYIII